MHDYFLRGRNICREKYGSVALLLPQNLLQILEHDAVHAVHDHPQQRQGGSDQFLTVFVGSPHVEHDVTDYVIVERKRGLLRKLGYEPYQMP